MSALLQGLQPALGKGLPANRKVCFKRIVDRLARMARPAQRIEPALEAKGVELMG